MARRVSFLAIADGQSSFRGRPFLRIGMIGVVWLSMMAVWQRRVTGADHDFWINVLVEGAHAVTPLAGRLDMPPNPPVTNFQL